MAKRYILSEGFEARGKWWLHTNPDNQVYGILRYNGTHISLSLSGAFTPIAFEDIFSPSTTAIRYPCVMGKSDSSEEFTLIDVLSTNRSTNDAGTNETVSATFAVIGSHFERGNDQELTIGKFYCTQLEHFTHYNPITIQREQPNTNDRRTVVSFQQPEDTEVSIPTISSKVRLETRDWIDRDTKNASINSSTSISIIPETSRNLKWHLQQMGRICNLLTLLTDEHVSLKEILVGRENERVINWLIYRSATAPKDGEEPQNVFLFHLDNLRDRLETIVQRWFGMSEMLFDATSLFMDARRNDHHSVQAHFLLAIQAVEVFSRATTDSLYMSPTEFETVKKQLIDAIPKGVPSDARNSLKARFEYLNEYSLKKRLTQLLESLSPKTRELICKNTKDFITGAVDSRNYLTHYSDEGRQNCLEAEALFWAGEKLLLLYRILLLRHLGLDEEEVAQRIRSHNRLGQRAVLASRHPERRTQHLHGQ